MIGTIRRHKNWLWGVIITCTIGTFVVYFSPNQRYGGGFGSHDSSAPNLGSINGEPITPEQLQSAEREAALFYRLRSGAWSESADQKKQILHIAEQSLVVQSLLNEYKITATTEAASRFTKQLFGVPQDQAMPLEKLNEWVTTELMRKGGLNMDDLDHFARHQAAQESLMALLGLSGTLITSKEAEFFYRRENQPIAAEIVAFPTTNFYSATVPTDADLQDYFTKHQADYRSPDRIVINYVVFDPSNYAAKAEQLLGTNIDDKVDQVYHQQGPDAWKDESGQVMSNTLAEAKIKKQMRLYAELGEARKDANIFLGALSEGRDDAHPYSPSDLENVAKAKGLVVKTTEPFDEKNGTNVLNLPPKALHLLFTLRDYAPGDPETTNDPERSMLYAPSPLVGETGIYITGLQKRIPSQLQTLDSVRDQVVKDYRASKSLTLAKDAGDKFAGALQVGLAQGKSFEAMCAAQNVTPQVLPPFALTTTNLPPGFDKPSYQQLQETIFPLPTGQSSRFISTSDGGIVAFVKDRLPVDETRMAQELPSYLARMREQRQIAAFTDWLNRQIQLRFIPGPNDQGGAG